MPQMPAALERSIAVSPLRKRPVAIAFLVLLVALFAAGLAGYAGWLTGQPGAVWGAFLAALALAALLSIPAIAFLWWLDRRERETVPVFAGILLFGLIAGMGLTLALAGAGAPAALGSLGLDAADVRSFDPLSQNTLPLSKIGADEVTKLAEGAAAIPALIEELLKLAALVLLIVFLRGEFDGVRDGIVYGGLVGLGFAVAESAFFITDGFLRSASLPLVQQLAARYTFLGLSGHLLSGALLGAGIGIVRQTDDRPTRIVAPIAFFLLALFAHLVQNSFALGVAGMTAQLLGLGEVPLKALPAGALWLCMATGLLLTLGLFYAILVNLAGRSGRWEQAVIASELADEVGKAITADEYRLLLGEGVFTLRTVPHAPAKTARAIVNAQNELAFRKWRVRTAGQDVETDPIVAAWHDDIARLRETVRNS